MTKMRSTLVSLMMLGVLACATESANSQRLQGGDEVVAEKILAGDPDAVEEAGKSGNQAFVPYLKHLLDSRKGNEAFNHLWPEELALARLGQAQQMQKFWCASLVDDPKHGVTPGPERLEMVGGWFAVQGLEKLLTPEGLIHWHKPTREERESDVGPLPLPVKALLVLSKVVPNPPESPQPEVIWAQTHTQERIHLWQDWIAAHKDELSQLKPSGEDVDFSPSACKSKPRKKH